MSTVAQAPTGAAPCPLTRRQLEVLKWLAEDKTAFEISIILGIARTTASEHVENAKRAIGVRKETALVATAFREGWIQ